MLNLDDKKLKCALILRYFILFYHTLIFVCGRNLSQVVSFLDAEDVLLNGCSYWLSYLLRVWGHDELSSVKGVANNKKANNGNNVILNKCRTYCQQVSDEMNQENAMMNNIANTNNNQMLNNINNQAANKMLTWL